MKGKIYLFSKIPLRVGLSNLPEASFGNGSIEKLMTAGILNAASLSDRNTLISSSEVSESSLRYIAVHKISPSLSSGMPNTLASNTSGCS